MNEPSKAVFLSYASQDAEAARRICEALRAGDVEVWFDQSELRGGDVWDRKIRREIGGCALFIPIISANTDERTEGYFRLEWKLAVDRSHLMADDAAFLMPVVIDATPDALARVPERFRQLQWSRLLSGETPPAFVERVARLLSPEPAHAPAAVSGKSATAAHTVSLRQPAPIPAPSRPMLRALLLIGAVAVFGVGYLVLDKFVLSKRPAASTQISAPIAQSGVSAPIAIPENSVAVLPFMDMSAKKDQEYFSDGMAEEIIDLLAKVPDLRVPARTSSFYFKGKSEDVPTIAKRLMVAHVLEGSVRTAGRNVRITVQLVRADNGYHLWSETYDRKLDDVFKIQDEIATAIVKALKVSLLQGSLASGARPGNAAAHALFLQGQYFQERDTRDDLAKAIAALEQAVRLEPASAPYWAQLSRAYSNTNNDLALPWKKLHDRALQAAEKALTLDPNLPEAHIARAKVAYYLELDFPVAVAEIAKAQQLGPTNPDVIEWSAAVAHLLGHVDESLRFAERSAALDPLSTNAYNMLAGDYLAGGRYADAQAAARKALDLNAGTESAHATIGLAMLLGGGDRDALLTEIAREPDAEAREYMLAVANQVIGNPSPAERWLAAHEPAALHTDAYNIAVLHALRGEADQAFTWLDKAYQLRDSGVTEIKRDPLLKSLRGDPRWAALLRKLKLPE